jgi:protein-tyrosine phosphatase
MESHIMQPHRILPIETGHNFRDIGGYTAADGRRVKWRKIYRSGYMSHIAGDDIAQLQALDIDTICDFRTNSERKHRPTLWHSDSKTELWARDYDFSSGAFFDVADRSMLSASQMRSAMILLYEHLPFAQAQSYREMFARIATGRVPLLFNCSAGKDRTGVAAALLLSLLGVDYDVIEQDYMLTNERMDGLIAFMEKEPKYSKYVTERKADAMPLLRAETEYLSTSFKAIETKHGSVEAYIQNELGLSHGDIAAVKAELLD